MNSHVDYHLQELQTTRDSDSPSYSMPAFLDSDRAILDVGCGIGQTFVGAEDIHDRFLVGVDIDLESESWGHDKFGYISFVNADACKLPFSDNAFDFVCSRVSLPYTDIPRALAEIARVLQPGGRVWLTLHTFGEAAKGWKAALASFKAKNLAYCGYVIVNGLIFNAFGRLVSWPLSGRCESFQSTGGMRRAMHKVGFSDIDTRINGRIFVCTAHKISERATN